MWTAHLPSLGFHGLEILVEMETLQTPEDHSDGALAFPFLCITYMHPPQPETQLISQGNSWLCLNSLSSWEPGDDPSVRLWTIFSILRPTTHSTSTPCPLCIRDARGRGSVQNRPREADCGKCHQGGNKWVCWGLAGGVNQINKVGQRRVLRKQG